MINIYEWRINNKINILFNRVSIFYIYVEGYIHRFEYLYEQEWNKDVGIFIYI